MPRRDGTGPEGLGPRTGRGAGPCGGSDEPGSESVGLGRSFGRVLGRRQGRGWRNRLRARGLTGWMRFGRRGEAAEEEPE
jgi:hypothetical protein